MRFVAPNGRLARVVAKMSPGSGSCELYSAREEMLVESRRLVEGGDWFERLAVDAYEGTGASLVDRVTGGVRAEFGAVRGKVWGGVWVEFLGGVFGRSLGGVQGTSSNENV